MKIKLFMRDGRTCYRLAKRGDLSKLLGAAADHTDASVEAEVCHWNGLQSTFTDFEPVKLRFIAKSAIGWIEEDRA